MRAQDQNPSSWLLALGHHVARHVPAYAVLAIGVALTIAAHDYVSKNLRASGALLFEEDTEELLSRLRRRLESYASTLATTGALMTNVKDPSDGEFQTYLRQLDVPNRAPGLEGAGFAVFHDGAAQHLVARVSSYMEATLGRLQAPPDAWITTPTAQDAITRARDFGDPVTAPIPGLDGCGTPADPAFATYVPVFAGPVAPTLISRRAAFRGVVFGTFCSSRLLDSLHTTRTRRTIELSLTTETASGVAARSATHPKGQAMHLRLEAGERLWRSESLQVAGERWSVLFLGPSPVDDGPGSMLAAFVGFSGIMATLLLFGIVISQVGARDAAELGEKRSQLLADAGRIFTTELEEPAAVEEVAKLPVPRFADACAVELFDGSGSKPFVYGPSTGSEVALAEELRVTEPITSPRLLTGDAELIADTREHDPSCSVASERVALLGARSVIRTPMMCRGEMLGLITFVSMQPLRRYGPMEVRMATDLARIVGAALDGARQYRLAQEANRLKDEFLSTLSHELRTPLNAILGWAHLLRSAALDEPTRQRAAETIERNARQQAQIVNDLLDVSRIILGQVHLERTPVELGAVIRESVEAARLAAEAKRIELVARCEPGGGYVLGDRARLLQIVWNLVSNAIKFTPSGGRVEVELRRTAETAEIIVRDDGQGISSDFLPYLFERFRQADGSSTRRHGGLGLGLAIVRHLVELHGGTALAESPGLGLGSTFTVRFSAVSPTTAPVELSKRERRTTTASGGLLITERKQVG